jgi:hypothetical protein
MQRRKPGQLSAVTPGLNHVARCTEDVSPGLSSARPVQFRFERSSGQQPPFPCNDPLLICHPEGNRGICSAPFVCPTPAGPEPPPIVTEPSCKHQPPLCLSAFPGEVRGTADPSASLGMTKRGGSLQGQGGCWMKQWFFKGACVPWTNVLG